MITVCDVSAEHWTGRWWEGNKGKLNVLIRRIIQTNSWSGIGGCSMEHCYLLGQMYSCLILKTLIQRLQSNQHFKENDQSRIFIEVCWSEFHDASSPLLDSGAAIDCELNKINHHFNTSWIKKRWDDGRTFFIQNSGATLMRRVTVGPQLSSIYTFNCLEIYFFQLHSTMFRQWNDGKKKLASFLAQILSFPLLFQIKLWLFESRFCWGVRRDSSKTGNVESNHAAAWSFS